jgi:hypothetical protein
MSPQCLLPRSIYHQEPAFATKTKLWGYDLLGFATPTPTAHPSLDDSSMNLSATSSLRTLALFYFFLVPFFGNVSVLAMDSRFQDAMR